MRGSARRVELYVRPIVSDRVDLPRTREALGDERLLERARYPQNGDVGGSVLAQDPLRAVEELLGDIAVEARDDDRESHTGRVEVTLFRRILPHRSGTPELLVDVIVGVVLGAEAEQVPELALLGAEVRDVLLVRHRPHRHPLDDLEAVTLD